MQDYELRGAFEYLEVVLWRLGRACSASSSNTPAKAAAKQARLELQKARHPVAGKAPQKEVLHCIPCCLMTLETIQSVYTICGEDSGANWPRARSGSIAIARERGPTCESEAPNAMSIRGYGHVHLLHHAELRQML